MGRGMRSFVLRRRSPRQVLLPAAAAVWLVIAGPYGYAAARRNAPQADYHEELVADFEPPAEQRYARDNRVSIEGDAKQATRGRACLKIELTTEAPVSLTFRLPVDALADHDWLEYDLIGAPAQSVYLETTFRHVAGNQDIAQLATVVDADPWRGQVLLPELLGERPREEAIVEVRLHALRAKSTLRLDAVRLVRDRPPPLPEHLGGAMQFVTTRSLGWPGFARLTETDVGSTPETWLWNANEIPRIGQLSWPDPLAREFLGTNALHRPEMRFTLARRLEPGRYEGVILAAPILEHGLKRPRFALRVNGMRVASQNWPQARMFSDDGVFAGRNDRDFRASTVYKRWVAPTFLTLPFSADVGNQGLIVESDGVFLSGLLVYPWNQRKTFQAFRKRLEARRAAYFAQQVYGCVHPRRSDPIGQPTPEETKAGVQLLLADVGRLSDLDFVPAQDQLIRNEARVHGLAGQTVTMAVGLLALEDLREIALRFERVRGGTRLHEIREFPVLWRAPVRRAVPYWLAPPGTRPLRKGQTVWYLVEVGLAPSNRGKEHTVRLRASARKKDAARLTVHVVSAPVRGKLPVPCCGVLYPTESQSGYLLGLAGPARDADVGRIVLDDYSMLRSFGLEATVLQGVYLSGDATRPRIHSRRASMRGKIAARADMCRRAPGWVDFSSVLISRQWREDLHEGIVAAAADGFRRLRIEFERMDLRTSALVASTLRMGGDPRLLAERILLLAEVLRRSGWPEVGLVFDLPEMTLQINPNDAGPGSIQKMAEQFDRVIAPYDSARALQGRIKRTRLELLCPDGGRFDTGFGPWAYGFDGVWIGKVHRRTVPYLPLESAHPDEQPLLIPYPETPAPTLRLVAVREGIHDLMIAYAAERLVKRRKDSRDPADDLQRALADFRRALQETHAAGAEAGDEDEVLDFTVLRSRVARRHPVPNPILEKVRRELLSLLHKHATAR